MTLTTGLKVFLEKNTESIEITNGIINIAGITGIDYYTGVADISDTGQLTITSRDENLDPHINTLARFNTRIRVEYNGLSIIWAYITDVTVDYGAHGEDTIVTINAVDSLGLVQRHKFTTQFSDYIRSYYPTGITLDGLTVELSGGYHANTGNTEIENFLCFPYADYIDDPNYQFTGNYARTAIKAGDSFWDVFKRLAQSSLFKLAQVGPNVFVTVPYIKYTDLSSSFVGNEIQDILDNGTLFASEPTSWLHGISFPYKSIILDDGFKRTINQVEISNSEINYAPSGTYDETTDSYGPTISQQSMIDWGSNKFSIETLFSGAENTSNTYYELSRDILERDSNPELDIAEITVDMQKYDITSLYLTPGIHSFAIKHKVNNSITIHKVYDLIGLKYDIGLTHALVTLVVKKSDLYYKQQGQIQQPQIIINATSGNTNYNFHASITNFPTGKIAQIDWELSGSHADGSEIINNPTPTWNYDIPISGPVLDWQGPGYKQVWATITTTDGWKVQSNTVELQITAAQPHADFTYSNDGFDGFTFVDASYDAQSWSWNFGDGTTSTLQNPPTKYYTTTGTKTVTLTVSNGVATNSLSKTITVTSNMIQVKYVKYNLKGTKTRPSSTGSWDKNLITSFHFVMPGVGQSGAWADSPIYWNAPLEVVNKTGVLKDQFGYTMSGYPYAKTTQDITTGHYVNIIPVVSNSGNTEQHDIDLIYDVSKQWSNNGNSDTPGGVDTETSLGIYHRNSWDNTGGNTNFRFNYGGSKIWPRNYVTNKTYEPIDIYVSANKTDWYKVGDINVYTTTYPPLGQFKSWETIHEVPMPPRYPV